MKTNSVKIVDIDLEFLDFIINPTPSKIEKIDKVVKEAYITYYGEEYRSQIEERFSQFDYLILEETSSIYNFIQNFLDSYKHQLIKELEENLEISLTDIKDSPLLPQSCLENNSIEDSLAFLEFYKNLPLLKDEINKKSPDSLKKYASIFNLRCTQIAKIKEIITPKLNRLNKIKEKCSKIATKYKIKFISDHPELLTKNEKDQFKQIIYTTNKLKKTTEFLENSSFQILKQRAFKLSKSQLSTLSNTPINIDEFIENSEILNLIFSPKDNTFPNILGDQILKYYETFLEIDPTEENKNLNIFSLEKTFFNSNPLFSNLQFYSQNKLKTGLEAFEALFESLIELTASYNQEIEKYEFTLPKKELKKLFFSDKIFQNMLKTYYSEKLKNYITNKIYKCKFIDDQLSNEYIGRVVNIDFGILKYGKKKIPLSAIYKILKFNRLFSVENNYIRSNFNEANTHEDGHIATSLGFGLLEDKEKYNFLDELFTDYVNVKILKILEDWDILNLDERELKNSIYNSHFFLIEPLFIYEDALKEMAQTKNNQVIYDIMGQENFEKYNSIVNEYGEKLKTYLEKYYANDENGTTMFQKKEKEYIQQTRKKVNDLINSVKNRQNLNNELTYHI